MQCVGFALKQIFPHGVFIHSWLIEIQNSRREASSGVHQSLMFLVVKTLNRFWLSNLSFAV